jgi:peptidoglycan/LPS O-acetylase OafA/YrhL
MCLFVIFIIGPFTTTLPLYQYFTKSTTYEYIETSSVFYFEHSTIPSVFENNPVKDIVNVSLGTLPIEFELYIIIAIIGVLGIITKRKYLLIAGFFGILIYTCLVLNTIPMLTSIYDFLNSIGIASFIIPFVKFTTYIPLSYPTFFLLGSIFYLYKDKINFDYKLVLSMATTLIICYFYLGMQNPIFLIFLTIFLPYIVLFFGSIKTPLNKFGDYGDYSYGIYIYGGPIQQMIVSKIPGIGSIELFFIALGISFIFAFISWNGIESRALKYKSIKFPDFEIFKKFIKNIE